MWKTPGRFWAQIGPFLHILAPKTAENHCTAVDLALFRKPYFNHLVDSNNFAPEIYLTPESIADNPWHTSSMVKPRYNPEQADILFLAGYDWKALDSWPSIEQHIPVINLIQGFGHCENRDERKQFLSRKALRVCVSHQLTDALMRTGLCNGPVVTIENGIDLSENNCAQNTGRPEHVLILGVKQRTIATQVAESLKSMGVMAQLVNEPIQRDSLLDLIVKSEIVVTLPCAKEGFYLPALEVMKLQRNLICPDCIGNRSFCEDFVTCLMPPYKVESLVGAVCHLLANKKFAASLRKAGHDRAALYTLERERKHFIAAISEYSKPSSPPQRP